MLVLEVYNNIIISIIHVTLYMYHTQNDNSIKIVWSVKNICDIGMIL